MVTWEKLKDVVMYLIDPWPFMLSSVKFIPATLAHLVKDGQLGTLLWPPALKEAWFGHFWAYIGPQVKTGAEKRVIPLLEGRIANAEVHDEVVGEPISGIVLEIGAGSGMWADVFAKVRQGGGGGGSTGAEAESGNGEVRQRKGSALKRVYGIEPNPKSSSALRQRVKDLGMEDLYQVVPVGIEDFNNPDAWDGRIEPGSVDCVVSILCLCSIPEPEKNIRLLYESLKKGGRWYAYEHVQVERGGIFMWLYQHFINLFWPTFLGGCELCRATGKTLREVGEWEKIDLAQPSDEPAYHCLPHILGTLTK